MHAKLNKNKIIGLMFALLLLGGSGTALAEKLAETFFQASAGEVSLPLQIAPELVDAPPRHVDLLPGSAMVKDIPGTGMPLSGFPVDLNEYPLLSLDADNQDPALYGIELSLDTRGKGAVDTIVRVGDPTLFPEMMKERIDLRAAEFVPNDMGYKIKRALGISKDQKWRYTATNCKVNSVISGAVNADFAPSGGLVLTRSFDSLELEKTPWLRYQYELPKGALWVVQINAKIDRGGLSPKLTTLLSRRFEGDGKQQILLNLNGLLHESYPDAKGGLLKELIINFHLDATASAAVANAHIDLGKLEFYQAQMFGQGNTPSVFLIATDVFAKTNLVKSLEKLVNGEMKVVGGRLIGTQRDLAEVPEVLPKVSLLATYQEKIPKLFVGETFYLNELNSNELLAMLDQKLFLEKNILWETGQSDVIFLKQIAPAGSNGSTRPLINYMMDVDVGDVAYILADYEVERGNQTLVYLTLSGIDRQGRGISIDQLLSKNKPIKISDLNLKKMTLSFRSVDLTSPLPSSFRVRKIQISKFQKTQAFRQRKSTAMISFDGGATPLDAPKAIWKVVPELINFDMLGNEAMQTIKNFAINQRIAGNTLVRFDLQPHGSETWFLRVKGKNRDGRVEQLFPLSSHGSVELIEMELQELDLVVKGGLDAGRGRIQINQMEIGIGERAQQKVIWSAQPKNYEISLRGRTELQTAMTFMVDKKITGEAVLEYGLALSSGPAMSYLLRLRGDNAWGYFERLIPLDLQGSLPLSEMDLHSLDLVVWGGDASVTTTVQLNRLMVKGNVISTQQKMFSMDDSLTYDEILSGGKLVKLPPTFIAQGEHRLDYYTTNDEIALSIAPAYNKVTQEQQATLGTKISPQLEGSKAPVYAGILVAALLLYIAGCRLLPGWLPPDLPPRLYGMGFWVAELALLGAAYYIVFKNEGKDAFSWGGVALVLAYGFAVRWRIRPLLARKWRYFTDHHSAPYFMMSIALLLSCAVLLMFKLEIVAEKLAVILYYLLVTGVAVEFIRFAKEDAQKAG